MSVRGHYFGRMIAGMTNRAPSPPPDPTPRRGRPPGLRIDGQFLSELTQSMRQSREELHERALGGSMSPGSRQRAWNRWEATGIMKNLATAEAVARVLGTTVAALQGGAPEPAPNRIAELAQQLRRQVDARNADTLAVLANAAADGDPAEAAAAGMATRIELAQLTRQLDRLDEISRVTGWSLRELAQPANLHGYWLVASERTTGTATTHIVIGVDAVMHHVESEVRGWLYSDQTEPPARAHPDARLTFREETPWFRVLLEHPTSTWENRTLSFVRCEPGEGGLTWTKPSRRDRSEIERVPLRFWSYANLIDGFAAGPRLRDLRRLRLAIERWCPSPGDEASAADDLRLMPEIVAVVEGDLPDLEDGLLEQMRANDGALHPLVVNWIAQGLWAALRPGLESWPRECWGLRASPGEIWLLLSTPPYLAIQQLGRKPLFEHRYRIVLVELMEDGNLRAQPWRGDSVADTMKLLSRCMQDLPGAPPADRLFVGPPRPKQPAHPADD